jgi:hypothetical protein
MKRNIEIFVEEKDASIITRNLRKTLKKISIKENGSLEVPFAFDIEIRKEIICAKIKIKGSFDDKVMLRRLVFDSILNLKKKGVTNPDSKEFLSELEKEIFKYIDKPKEEFIILFPLNSSGGVLKRKRWFNIQNTRFYKSDWEKVHNFPGWNDFINHAKSIKYMASNLKEQILPMYQNFTPLIANVKARNKDEAFQRLNKKYEIMRSILNLYFKFGTVTFQDGPPQPLGAILPPIFYGLFNKNGEYISLFFNEEPYVYKRISLKPNNIDNLNRMIKRMNSMDEEIKSVFVDSLVKYGHALDTIDWRDAFLTLWQILENLSLSTLSSRMKMTDVCSRIKNLMGITDILHKELVEALVETRNKLVHLGKFSQDGLLEVDFLKIIVDRALSNFYWLSKKFPSKNALEEFFQIATLPESMLEKRKSIAESVIQIHQKSTIR